MANAVLRRALFGMICLPALVWRLMTIGPLQIDGGVAVAAQCDDIEDLGVIGTGQLQKPYVLLRDVRLVVRKRDK